MNQYLHIKGGKRVDLNNQYFRSKAEANYARVLNLLVKQGEIQGWEYETKTFEFTGIKKGTRFYTPDFKVIQQCSTCIGKGWTFLGRGIVGGTPPKCVDCDGTGSTYEWHEVKGYFDAKSKTKLKRMAKYYPNEKIRIIDAAFFKDAKRKGLDILIPNWE